jgi:hypothetical protein
MRLTSIALTLTAVALLTGCATTTHVRTDLAFQAKSAKVPKSVLIEVPADAKNYVAEAKYAMNTWRVPVGQALEPNALRAFGTIIEKVTAEKGGATADRTIELSFDSQTGIRLGAFTFSANTCIVGLKCSIKDSSGKSVWSGTARAEASKSSAIGFLGGIFGNYAYTSSLGKAADAAIAQALQDLANQVESQKNTIFE